jgi:hypothetical protein
VAADTERLQREREGGYGHERGGGGGGERGTSVGHAELEEEATNLGFGCIVVLDDRSAT